MVCGARHLPHVSLVRRIPFLDRESRIAGRQTIGLRLRKVDLLACHVTEVVSGEVGGEVRVLNESLLDMAENQTFGRIAISMFLGHQIKSKQLAVLQKIEMRPQSQCAAIKIPAPIQVF